MTSCSTEHICTEHRSGIWFTFYNNYKFCKWCTKSIRCSTFLSLDRCLLWIHVWGYYFWVIYLTYRMLFSSGQVGWVSWTIKAVLWADGERHTDAKPRLSHWWSEPAAGLRSVTPLRAVWTSLKNVFSLFMWHWPFYTWAISPFSLKRLFKSSKWTKIHKYFHAHLTHGVKRTKLASQRKDESTPLS